MTRSPFRKVLTRLLNNSKSLGDHEIADEIASGAGRAATTSVTRDRSYSGPERRFMQPITVERASRVLRRTTEEVLALADQWDLCAYYCGDKLMFPPTRFRAFYSRLVKAT